jgi:hypothetical protein
VTVRIPITEEYQDGYISKLFFRRYRFAMGKDQESLAEWRETGCSTTFADWHLAKFGARIETGRYPHILEFDNEEDATYFLLRWS